MTKKEQLIKEGGQSKVVNRKTGIFKVFKHRETYKRENQIHMSLIQPLNKMHVYSPFIEVYPSENDSKESVKPKNELRMKQYLCDYSQIMKNQPKSSELQVKLDFLQMVYAVYCLHHNNIYHGDIKPDNFLVEINPQDFIMEIKLGDFGGALQLRSRDQKINLPHCYTKEYHPHDLMNDHLPYDPFQADCFALGVVLDQMSSHLQKSIELQNIILLLKSQSIQIEDIFNTSWIYNDMTASKFLILISQKTNQVDNNSLKILPNSLYLQQKETGFQYQQIYNKCFTPQQQPTTQMLAYNQQNLKGRYCQSQSSVSSNQIIVVDNDTTSFLFIN